MNNSAEIPPFSWLGELVLLNLETSMILLPVAGLKLLYARTGFAA